MRTKPRRSNNTSKPWFTKRLAQLFFRFFPALYTHLIVQLWFRTRHFPLSKQEASLAKTAKTKRFHSNNSYFYAYEWGSGEDIILFIHGWNGHGLQFVKLVDALIKQGYRVLSFDAPAHGRSPGKQTNLMEIAAAVKLLMQDQSTPSLIISHSFGFAVASYALAHGYVHSRALLGIAAATDTERLYQQYFDYLGLSEKQRQGFLRAVEQRLGRQWQQQIQPEKNLATLHMPILLIHDPSDRQVRISEVKRLLEKFPNIELQLTQGQGHQRILQSPQTEAICLKFLLEKTKT